MRLEYVFACWVWVLYVEILFIEKKIPIVTNVWPFLPEFSAILTRKLETCYIFCIIALYVFHYMFWLTAVAKINVVLDNTSVVSEVF